MEKPTPHYKLTLVKAFVEAGKVYVSFKEL
jgi:hypothetical protein